MPQQPNITLDDETPPIDMRSLTRLGLWGGAATAALLLVAIASFTATGQRRLSELFQPAGQQISAAEEERRGLLREVEQDRRRKDEQIRDLADDRDRLAIRMNRLERNYEDVTGSISKLNTAARAPDAPVQPPVAVVPPPVAPVAQQRTELNTVEFGIDIGGAPSIAAMRLAWERIHRNHASALEGLRPVIGVRDGRNGLAELRLVAGPIQEAASAIRLCSLLTASGQLCQPAIFDGQRLAQR